MKGFIQILQVIFSCIGIIVIVSILINKSPFNLITGLGAFTAVLMLIFKDTILGFVAGVLISENDMVRIGDWIEMPQNNVNGIVTDITLTVVKVQNFDNTTVTVPPYSLVSGSFINWRGMSDSGGRRIMREYSLKLDYIKPCTPEFLEKMKSFDEELGKFITEKQQQAAAGQTVNTDNPAGLVNGTIDTNVGLFRAYMTLYLKRHPAINKDLLLMVRTLAPTANGLPVQIYCFSANKNWPSYESIQAEILEHFVSVLPAFELYPFQNADARDTLISGFVESGKVDISTIDGIPWHSILPGKAPVPTPRPGRRATGTGTTGKRITGQQQGRTRPRNGTAVKTAGEPTKSRFPCFISAVFRPLFRPSLIRPPFQNGNPSGRSRDRRPHW